MGCTRILLGVSVGVFILILYYIKVATYAGDRQSKYMVDALDLDLPSVYGIRTFSSLFKSPQATDTDYSTVSARTESSIFTVTTSKQQVVQSRTAISKASSNLSPNLESMFADRRQTIRNGCKARNFTFNDRKNVENIPNKIRVELSHALLYCGIPKVGSTFWSRVLTVLGSNGQLISPFQITLGQVHLPQFHIIKSEVTAKELKALLDKSISFMFVRDPYARLFSGYENKIYHPNGMFMGGTGRTVVRTVRASPSTYSLENGHDVTFAEFVNFIVSQSETGKAIDGHFSPMHKKCNPCQMRYDYIGKLESIREEAKYLIDVWKQKYPDIKLDLDQMESERAIDSARGHVRFLYGIMKKVKLFPAHLFMLRTWRDLQIRGFLSKHIPFPYSDLEAKNVTQERYLEDIRRALEKPANKTAVKLQRQEALVEAYQTVPLDFMERLRKYVLTDCLTFGYDDRPASLFQRDKNINNGFVYLDGISDK